MIAWIRRHRLAAFFTLSFAISWWVWPFYELDIAPTPFFACGPLVAALIIIGITEGGPGYRALGARLVRWRVGWQWWVVAVGLPFVVLAIASLANVTIWGAPAPVLANISWGSVAFTAAIRFVDPLDGPLGEEPGWRGWALPELQRRQSPLGAAVILGAIVALWHLPLVSAGQLAPVGMVATFGITLVYAWLFNHTGGSILLTMVFHVAQGTVGLAVLGFAGADADRMDWLTGCLWCLIAAGLVVADRNAWRVAPASAIAVHGPLPVER
jgi:membrane protease YdiL (CAAX protease family)